ncbi:hypothetical protein RRF57_000925 [Xylaria bambusicola]|uniref:Uncharacterized protein n=1 Tax=Xylaria bambusicola TaxID=326684 RepID=A0AAN7UAQ4_9PEZI
MPDPAQESPNCFLYNQGEIVHIIDYILERSVSCPCISNFDSRDHKRQCHTADASSSNSAKAFQLHHDLFRPYISLLITLTKRISQAVANEKCTKSIDSGLCMKSNILNRFKLVDKVTPWGWYPPFD